MKTILITLFSIIFFFTSLSAQIKDNYLISFHDDTKGKYGLYGYQTTEGEIVIEAQYSLIYTDTLYTVAMVISEDKGLIAIDQNGNFLLKPFVFDNGPDYLKEGLFRFEENGKIGFADKDCNIVITAQFDFAGPFGELDEFGQFIDYDDFEDPEIEHYEMGLAIYYIGGQKTYMDPEHWYWDNWDQKGFVNKQGQRFSRISEWKEDGWEAWTIDEKHVKLNNKGEIIQTF